MGSEWLVAFDPGEAEAIGWFTIQMSVAVGAKRRVYDLAVLGKALDVLEALAPDSPLGLSELSARTGINKASVFRILSTLERRGYVVKDPDNRRYRPGPSLIALTTALIAGLDLVQSARPVLESLHAEFAETVNLGIMSEGQVLYLDMVESRQGLRTAAHVGMRDPLHGTALGKSMLACLPTPEARRLLASYRRAAATPHTIVALGALEEELARTLARGYAVDNEENELGARCVGAAICDGTGRPIAAVSVSGPVSRLTDETVDRIGSRVRQAAHEIGVRLGHADPRRRAAL